MGTLAISIFSPTFPTNCWAVWVRRRIRLSFPPIRLAFIEKCHTFPSSASLWCRCEVPLALHSLVTAYLQRSQAQPSGTAPRSRLGDRGVSQETEHKYRDPNNLITSGAIRPRILEAYPREGVCVWRRAAEGKLGTARTMKVSRWSQWSGHVEMCCLC